MRAARFPERERERNDNCACGILRNVGNVDAYMFDAMYLAVATAAVRDFRRSS